MDSNLQSGEERISFEISMPKKMFATFFTEQQKSYFSISHPGTGIVWESQPFEYNEKQPGDLIRSQDWNEATQEVVRLENAKVNRSGEETMVGPLTIKNKVSIGNGNSGVEVNTNSTILMKKNNEELFALGALQNLKVIAGNVSTEGNSNGQGFTSKRSGKGKYIIQFLDSSFSETPIVVGSVTIDFDHIITIYDISKEKFYVQIRDLSVKDFQDSSFSFIAIGVR